MDIATILGLTGSFAFVLMAMLLGGGIAMFFDIPSVLIVIAGSNFVVMSKFNLGQYFAASKIALKAFIYKIEAPEGLIVNAVELANTARKGGFLALEGADITNSFLQKGINLLVDGHDIAVVENTLTKDLDLMLERHDLGIKVFRALADVAPAMGMVGTLIGLVGMLSNMDDPKSIGPAMAIALLTTLYGAIIANMVANPIADKLALRSAEEELNRRLILDAVLGIQNGQNPRIIEDTLKNYLEENRRKEREQ